MDPVDLEQLIHRELQKLPPPRAPRTLMPRILAAVSDARRPWYARAWLTWPVGWQLASAALVMAIIAGSAVVLPQLRAAATTLTFIADVRGDVAESTSSIQGAATAVRVLWRAIVAPVVPYAFGLITLMCAACAVFGTALNHLVFGKAFR
jgi:hypothetical protein